MNSEIFSQWEWNSAHNVKGKSKWRRFLWIWTTKANLIIQKRLDHKVFTVYTTYSIFSIFLMLLLSSHRVFNPVYSSKPSIVWKPLWCKYRTVLSLGVIYKLFCRQCSWKEDQIKHLSEMCLNIFGKIRWQKSL